MVNLQVPKAVGTWRNICGDALKFNSNILLILLNVFLQDSSINSSTYYSTIYYKISARKFCIIMIDFKIIRLTPL